jgi:hypothetical protein
VLLYKYNAIASVTCGVGADLDRALRSSLAATAAGCAAEAQPRIQPCAQPRVEACGTACAGQRGQHTVLLARKTCLQPGLLQGKRAVSARALASLNEALNKCIVWLERQMQGACYLGWHSYVLCLSHGNPTTCYAWPCSAYLNEPCCKWCSQHIR